MSQFIKALCGVDNFRVGVTRVSDSVGRRLVRDSRGRVRIVRDAKNSGYNGAKVLELAERAKAMGYVPAKGLGLVSTIDEMVDFLRAKGEDVGDIHSDYTKRGNQHFIDSARGGVVRDSRVRRGVVRDTAMRMRRVKDSVSVEELHRFAKDHTDWESYKEGIRHYFDDRSYAVISADTDDASYKVQFKGFSQDKDGELVRRYTDLDRAAKFAYARGKDMMGDDNDGEKMEDSVRRRVVRDSRGVIKVRRVKDAEDFNGEFLEVIRRAIRAGFKPDGSQSMSKVGEAAAQFLKEKESGAVDGKTKKDKSTEGRAVRDSRRRVVRDSQVHRIVRR